MKVKAPSGVEFDVVDSKISNNPRLSLFRPSELISTGRHLPRYYFVLTSALDLKKSLTDHFQLKECLSGEEVSSSISFPYYVPVATIRLVEALELLRSKLGNHPISCTGFRSPMHSLYQSGNRNKASPHRFGTAIDIQAVGGNKINSQADLDFVYSAALDRQVILSQRRNDLSTLGFEYAESAAEMGTIDHAHLDLGYISTADGFDELDFIHRFLVDDDSQQGQTGHVNSNVTSTLSLRSQASVSSTVLVRLAPGTQLKILASVTGSIYPPGGRTDWYEVVVNGQRGFVAAFYVDIDPEA
jgi:hypothetical protein